MKILYVVPAIALSVLLQAELLDLSPLLKIMADAPVYAIFFVWLFFLQNKREERLLKAIILMAGKKPNPDEDE